MIYRPLGHKVLPDKRGDYGQKPGAVPADRPRPSHSGPTPPAASEGLLGIWFLGIGACTGYAAAQNQAGRYYISTDGFYWFPSSDAFWTRAITSSAYANGMWVVGGQDIGPSGKVFSSIDPQEGSWGIAPPYGFTGGTNALPATDYNNDTGIFTVPVVGSGNQTIRNDISPADPPDQNWPRQGINSEANILEPTVSCVGFGTLGLVEVRIATRTIILNASSEDALFNPVPPQFWGRHLTDYIEARRSGTGTWEALPPSTSARPNGNPILSGALPQCAGMVINALVWGVIVRQIPLLFDQYQDGTPTWTVTFARGKLSPLGESGTLSVPVFVGHQDLPTDTISNDQVIDSNPTITITGGVMNVATPLRILFSRKGFLIFWNAELVADPHVPGSQQTWHNHFIPGSFTCFDPKGQPCTVEEATPDEGAKGLEIASDNTGIWYMSEDQGLRKYANANATSPMMNLGRPDTVDFDDETNELIFVQTAGGDHADNIGSGEIARYNLAGVLQSHIVCGDEFDGDFDGHDCSRKGRIYGLRAQSSGAQGAQVVYSIEAYDYDGTHMFTVPPIGGFGTPGFPVEFFRSIVCYGESYIVVGTFEQTFGNNIVGTEPGAGGSFSLVVEAWTLTTHRRRTYHAVTGALIESVTYGPMRSSSITTHPDRPTSNRSVITNTLDHYGVDQRIGRADYFPRTNFTLP